MKKILILTRHAYPNYGSILQAHALQDILKKEGYKAAIIDYQNRSEQGWRLGISSLKNSRMNNNILKKSLYLLIQIPNFYIMNRFFSKFRKRLLEVTKEFNSVSELEKENLQADIFCTGSDQVWNTINQKLDPVYFWDFKTNNENSKIVSYSSSLGNDKITKNINGQIKKLLKPFDYISVRERSGKRIIRNMGYEVKCTVDPVMLEPVNYWNNFANMEIKEKNYILVYQLHDNILFKNCLDKIVQDNRNCSVIRVTPDFKYLKFRNKTKILLSPEKFLSYFKNAKYVITDSFHGSVFSLIYNVPFIDILPPKNDARNRDLLALFDLEERIVSSMEQTEILHRNIDFISVNKKLENLRIESHSILISMIED